MKRGNYNKCISKEIKSEIISKINCKVLSINEAGRVYKIKSDTIRNWIRSRYIKCSVDKRILENKVDKTTAVCVDLEEVGVDNTIAVGVDIPEDSDVLGILDKVLNENVVLIDKCNKLQNKLNITKLNLKKLVNIKLNKYSKLEAYKMILEYQGLYFNIKNVKGDGNCFWRCISYSLCEKEIKFNTYKTKVLDYMINDKEHFIFNLFGHLGDEANEIFNYLVSNLNIKDSYTDEVGALCKVLKHLYNINIHIYMVNLIETETYKVETPMCELGTDIYLLKNESDANSNNSHYMVLVPI